MTARFRLYLLRHGAPVLSGRMLGRTDSPVTADGIAACVARAKDLSVTHRIASDLSRARTCAEAMGPTAIDPRWRELDFGDWDGQAADAIDPAALSAFWDDPDRARPPGGERWTSPRMTFVGIVEASINLPYAALLTLDVWEGEPRTAQVVGLAT